MLIKSLTAVLFIVSSIGTGFVWVHAFILAQTGNASPWDIGKDITMAAMFTGFLFYIYPAREASHKSERLDLTNRLDNALTNNVNVIKEITLEHAATISKIAEHQEKTNSGYMEVSNRVALELHDLSDKVSQIAHSKLSTPQDEHHV